jgi:hypothetical protein
VIVQNARSVELVVKGFPGHPSHPPVTDPSIGAYTVATAMFILGALGHRGEHRWNPTLC